MMKRVLFLLVVLGVAVAAFSPPESAWAVEKAVAAVTQEKVNVNTATAEELTQLKGIGETMTAEWLKKSGSEGQKIVDDFKAMK